MLRSAGATRLSLPDPASIAALLLVLADSLVCAGLPPELLAAASPRSCGLVSARSCWLLLAAALQVATSASGTRGATDT